MVITEREDVTKQGSCKILWRKLLLRGSLLLLRTYSILGVVANLSLSRSGRKVWWGGRLFEAGRLLTFSAFRLGAYSNKYGTCQLPWMIVFLLSMSITHLLFALGEWWRKLACARSCTRHFLRDYIFFYLTVCKDFSLHTERKFTKTVNDNKLVIHQQDFFSKEKNLQRKMRTRHITALKSFRCYLWALTKSNCSPFILMYNKW